MKTGRYPYRKKENRYRSVQRCLDERLQGGRFDYDVYMSCVGCPTCNQNKRKKQPEQQVKKVVRKPKRAEARKAIFKFQMKALSILNRDNDIYNEDLQI